MREQEYLRLNKIVARINGELQKQGLVIYATHVAPEINDGLYEISWVYDFKETKDFNPIFLRTYFPIQTSSKKIIKQKVLLEISKFMLERFL